jgi:hypothetical protein
VAIALAVCSCVMAADAASPAPGSTGAGTPAENASAAPSPPSVETAPSSERLAEPIAPVDIVRANLEPSYLAFPIIISGIDPLVFEANIAPHFSLLPRSLSVALVLTPKIVLRMFQQTSVPVRTPSYMPRLTLFAWFDRTFTGRPLFYSSLTLEHHSNGQSGPFLNIDGTNNHESGSFATTFFDLSLFRAAWKPKLLDFSQVTLEWHPGIGDELGPKGRYGRVRVHLGTTLLLHPIADAKVDVRLTSILDHFQASSDSPVVKQLERFPFSVRCIVKIPDVDVGIYGSYYFGQDYYNIWFDRLVNVFQIGIGADVSSSLPKDL